MSNPVVTPPRPVVLPPPAASIKDGDGNVLGALPISDQDKAQLAARGKITMTFHTPRMFQKTMVARNFTVTLTQDANGNITGDPGQIAQATSHLAEIASAQALGVVIKE